MPRILILYGTTDGHTGKIARVLGRTLEAQGCSVDVVDARAQGAAPSPESYDGVVVAASVHKGRYQRAVTGWVYAHAEALNQRPTAFLSVSLAILEKDPKAHADLNRILHGFLVQTGWHAPIRKFVAGATLFSRYGLLTRWVMRRIVTKAVGHVDTTRDTEYTDWEDLRSFGREFALLSRPPQGTSRPQVSWA
jgi:menaquinone-dependent protoporphyrinogen oxidase